jgi:acyl-CoA thioester hydrolase
MEISELLTSFKFKLKIQIRFKDIDKQGHVNNAVHLTYFETARTDYFKEVLRKKNDWDKTGIILAKTEITYKHPVLLEDNLYCYIKINRLGTKSFDVESLLIAESENGSQLCAIGTSTMVCFNYNNNQTIDIPKEWIDSVKEFEK